MRTKLKLVLVLASLGALAALAMASTAAAGAPESILFEAGDPMTTNVPYVAWSGEEVRLVKCIHDKSGDWLDADAEWGIVDSSVKQRSGDLRDPVFFDDTDQRTEAFAELERAYHENSAFLYQIEIDPKMEHLRDDARFARVSKRNGKAPEKTR